MGEGAGLDVINWPRRGRNVLNIDPRTEYSDASDRQITGEIKQYQASLHFVKTRRRLS